MSLIAAFALVLTPDADLGWLVGTWCTERDSPRKTRTCEKWEPMAGGGLRGRTTVWRERTTTEQMRIMIEPERLVFHAEPDKQAPADFYAADVEGLSVRFENRAHDYPQVVRYWREGELLMAEISLADGSKPQRWMYRREK